MGRDFLSLNQSSDVSCITKLLVAGPSINTKIRGRTASFLTRDRVPQEWQDAYFVL